MASTNFGALTANQLKVWSKDFWRETRNKTFIMSFAGSTSNSMIQRITELKKTVDGDRAVITLVNETVGDGTVGDNHLEGNEEAMSQDEMVIRMDQWRHAHRNAGKMAEQRTIVNFREEAKDKLSYAAARIMDELAFLTMSGVSYAFRPDGTARTGSQLPQLAFSGDVTVPTSKRHFRWNGTTKDLVAADTSQIAIADTPSWEMLVDIKAKAINEYIRPIRTEDGVESYNVFMTPDGIAALKKDTQFLEAWKHAQSRGETNPLFKGTRHGGTGGITIDGLNIMEYRNVYHSSTWGAGAVSGQRILVCGAQALAFADYGAATWEEKEFDYGNVMGIATAKTFGLLKPTLYSTYAQSRQDFGVMCVDTAI